MALALGTAGCADSPNAPAPPPPAPVSPPTTVFGPPTAIVGVRVVPMSSHGERPDQTILTRDGMIVEVGPSESVTVPADAEVIDGTGLWAMPGLADMHTHLGTNYSEFTNRLPPEAELQEMAEGQMLLYLANGVTTVLNNGDFVEPVLRWRNEVLEGRYPGPTIYGAQYARGPPGTPDGGPPQRSVANAAEARAFEAAARAEGWHFIKIYNWTPAPAVDAFLASARTGGLPVIGHLPFTVSAPAALAGGLSMVAHADSYLWSYLRDAVRRSAIPEIVGMTVAAGAAVTTTTGISRTIAEIWGGNQAGIDQFWARPENRFMHWTEVGLHAEGIQGPRWNPAGARPGGLDERHAFVKEYTRALYDAGVPLLAGSDSPSVLGVAGFSMLFELEALAGLGLTPQQVLEIATRNAGRFIEARLGAAERFGTIEVGQRADLILLRSNPLVDLAAVSDREGVMARGHWFPESDLQRGLEALASRYR